MNGDFAVPTEKFGIYVHIPFCKSKCKYCAFVSTPDLSLQSDYVDALVNEIAASPYGGAECDTVYIGGGTPSCLFDGAIARIFAALNKFFSIDGSAEITVECNPESVTDGFISECKSSGVNRISMGLQSSDDNVLRGIGRIHTFDGYLSALGRLSKSFDNISTDLILGLPNQSEADIARALDCVIPICSHVSVYALTVEEGTPLYSDGYAADDDFVADLYDYVYKRLQAHKINRYEVSNFARRGKQSIHNLKYWRNMPYIGFGAAAHGYDGIDTRYVHSDDIVGYIENPAPTAVKLSDKDRYNEYVMLALRTERGIDLNDFEKTFGYSLMRTREAAIDRLKNAGYVETDGVFLRISRNYMFVMNGIIEELMTD